MHLIPKPLSCVRTQGSKRNRILFRLYPQCGFYSQKEIKEIVSYARSQHMKVVPETDLPGHFSAALAAYPEYGCAKTKCKVRETFGVKFNVACIGNPETVPFLYDILDKLIELFPDGEIHLAESHRKLLNSYSSYFYFDFPYALAPLKQTYEAPLSVHGKESIGIEGCLWTELVPNQAQAERICAPRLLATAEKGWTNPDLLDYNDFIARCRTFPYYRCIGMESYPESRWNPTGICALAGRIWWERRQLYRGAVGNLYQNTKAKHSITRRKKKS